MLMFCTSFITILNLRKYNYLMLGKVIFIALINGLSTHLIVHTFLNVLSIIHYVLTINYTFYSISILGDIEESTWRSTTKKHRDAARVVDSAHIAVSLVLLMLY